MPRPLRSCLAVLLPFCFATAAYAQSSYQLFEAGQVRPLALSPDGQQLFAVNTPDDHLEIFDVAVDGILHHAGSVQVGMRPVAVAARTNDEVWVVNHLSDSISIVKLSPQPHVIRTLLVGDEPRDLVFAGSGGDRAFITTAHRGQHSPNGGRINRTSPNADDQSQSDTEGIGRADVWVFDATTLGSELGGTPSTVITLFGDKPRALAVNDDGSRVYAAIYRSGNQTTVVNEGLLCPTSSGNMNSNTVQPACTINSVSVPGGYPTPHKNSANDDRPPTGLILKFDRPGATPGRWTDELDRNWDPVVKLDLPDLDVFEIDANANPPAPTNADANNGNAPCASSGGAGCWARVGTTIFNMVVNPMSGKVYVSNTDAQNHVRFEGPGIHAAASKPGGEPTTVQGNLAQSRITVLDGSSVDPRHLNKHLDYSVLPAPASDRDKSLATPAGMAVSSDGSTLYVAAFGSGKIGVYDTTELENDTFDADNPDQIQLGGGGPSGLVLDDDRLYVLTRFDNSVRVVNVNTSTEMQVKALHSPEPPEVVDGRPFLYDAVLTSSNGEASCSSCHIFGDTDDLAWDLGNPDDVVVPNTNPFNPVVPVNGALPFEFHPMKGPMGTQSLRGLAHMGPQHWRGDRQGDETQAFEAFNLAFTGLVGRASQVSGAEMTDFREFALLLRYPPNPIRKVDNSLRPDEAAGLTIYNNDITDIIATCNGCHVLDPANGHFGGDGRSVFDGEPQHLKVPHLRNAYQKVGAFGMSQPNPSVIIPGGEFMFTGDFSHQGPQVRGFGFLHDASVDSLGRFIGLDGFSMNPTEDGQMEAFVMAFPSDLAPVVGQQLTLNAANFSDGDVNTHLATLIARAGTSFPSQVLGMGARECDLVAKLNEGGVETGYLFDPDAGVSGLFLPDDGGAGIDDTTLRNKALTAGQEVTYTCQTPGAGQRTALDRDEDTLLNGVETNTGIFVSASNTGTSPALADSDGDGFDDAAEVAAGTNPNNPLDFPGAPPVPALSPTGLSLLLAAMSGVAWGALRRRSRF